MLTSPYLGVVQTEAIPPGARAVPSMVQTPRVKGSSIYRELRVFYRLRLVQRARGREFPDEAKKVCSLKEIFEIFLNIPI